MVLDNKTFLIVGLVIGGLFSLYIKNTELASVIFGGLIGYLSKDTITLKNELSEQEDMDGFDPEDP